MLNLTYNILRNIKNRIRQYFFLHKYRKDTPESTQKFYSRMRYVYKKEFKKREDYSKKLSNTKINNILNERGFVILKLNDLSDNEEFFDLLSKFRNKFDEVVDISKGKLQKKNYLLQYNFEFNNDVKRIADTFVDVVTKYLGTLPVLDSFQMWYSPNNDEELIGSKLFHRDPEDFKQIKIFIPIDEITTDNGPLRVIDKNQSKFLYDSLIKTGVIKKRNQKIDDDQLLKYKITDNKVILNNNQCALVDTCACYHLGSRKSLKPRKLIFLHFTSAFSAKSPILRNYDKENKFSSDKDKMVYGLQKKNINHYKKRQYLNI